MLKSLACALVLFALVAVPLGVPAQTTAEQEPQDEVVRVGASEVKLDVVVRDKKGRIVRDLKPEELEVYEDGVRQQVGSFRLVAREPGGSVVAETSETAAAPKRKTTSAPAARGLERVGAVALVFDRLTPDSRTRARQAALGFLANGLGAQDFVGVFQVDLSLRILQPFTNNEQLVRAAIERASGHSSTNTAGRAGQIADVAQTQAQLESAQASIQSQGAGGAGTDTQAVGGAAMSNSVEQVFAEMTRRSLETFDILERDQKGYATTNGLLAVTNALARLPGRKVLLLFSEGIAVPSSVESPFRALISNANRAGVSIYAVDAAGLRATSSDAETGRALTALGQQRIRQAASNRDPGQPMMRDLERNEDLLRYNPDSGLGQLAEQTGGMLIKNTNDPAARLRQVDEDLHTYYALSYIPRNQVYDGRFRQISVKATRPGIEVQARKGYYAINADYASPVLAYEAPALALLSGGRSPASFPLQAAAFSFPETAHPGLVPIVVEIPAGAVDFSVDTEKKTYQTDFSIVALVKDESQRVVSKLSNQYRLSGPLDQLASVKRGAILFYREAELAPGRYTIAAAAHDALTGRASVASASVVVPAETATGPRLASVVIVKRAEALKPDEKRSDNPFRFGELLVYPNVGEPVRKSASKEMVLLLTAYASRGSKAAPKLTLEITQGARSLGKSSLNLPSPDLSGRMQLASAIPTDKLSPGTYELRVTATDERGTATRSEQFTVQP